MQLRYLFLLTLFLFMFLALFDAITKAYGLTMFETDMVAIIIDFVYIVGSLFMATINFIGDLFSGKFNIVGLIAVFIKAGVWSTATIVAVISEIIGLPFRLIGLVFERVVFGGLYGKNSVIPTAYQLATFQESFKLIFTFAFDFVKGGELHISFAFRNYVVIYNPVRELGILMVFDDRLFFLFEFNISKLGGKAIGFIFGNFSGDFYLFKAIQDLLKDLADSLGTWRELFDKLLNNEAII